MKRFLMPVLTLVLIAITAPAMAQPKRIIAFGDSLTAGYGLPPGEDFATKLQEALIAEGHDVVIDNQGISGNTTADGRQRIAAALATPPKPDLVIIALGANDMLRRLDPAKTRENLAAIIEAVQAQDIPVLLVGVRGLLGGVPFFKNQFDKVYADLADEYNVPLHDSFLKGVSMKAELNQPDGLHPNQKGVAIMVDNILPRVEKLID